MVNDPITKIMQDASEIVRYDEVGIPLSIREGFLSAYPNHRALCHWHEDIEWVYIRSGQMNYYMNGKRVLLNTGEALMVNSRQMHYGYSVFCVIPKFSSRTVFCTSRILHRFSRIRLWNIFI